MCRLVKFEKYDFNDYYSLVSNQKVMQQITERAIPIDEARENYLSIIKRNFMHDDFGSFKIINNKDNAFLGSAMLKVGSLDSKEAEIGYMLLPQNWGRGIGTKVAGLLVGMAKKQEHLTSLKAIIDPENLPSKKILERMGFVSVEVGVVVGLASETLRLDLK